MLFSFIRKYFTICTCNKPINISLIVLKVSYWLVMYSTCIEPSFSKFLVCHLASFGLHLCLAVDLWGPLPICTCFICHNLAILSFNNQRFSIFSHSISHTLVSPGIAMSIIIVSLLYQLCNIWPSSFYHVITLSREIPYNFEVSVFSYSF